MQILIGIALLAVACVPSIPPPSSAPPQPTTTGVATRPAPEDCDDFVAVPCPRQVARLSIPLAGSSFSLTYASDRAPGRTVAPSLDAAPNGLGGWSLNEGRRSSEAW